MRPPVILSLVFLFCGRRVRGAVNAKKIAVIGGGISGSFFTKYLVDYDSKCELESFTIFEPYPVIETIKTKDVAVSADNANFQGSRVASLELDDGSVVEVGASVLYKGFYLVLDMLRKGGLETDEPFATGKDDNDAANLRDGMGIYDGNGAWALLTTGVPGFLKRWQMVLRYNWDLLKVSKICQQALSKFATLPAMLASTNPEFFFDTPQDVWEALGLSKAVHNSYDQLLDVIGLSNEMSWWRKYLPYQGILRKELLTAINLVNYNQDNANVNGMVGLGSFAASSGGLMSVKGGNYQIIHSAFQQAVQNRDAHCIRKGTVTQVIKRVTTVVGDLEGLSLFSGEEELGEFDIVILAAPLQQSQIHFLIQSHFDRSVVQPMPLGGRVKAHDTEVPEDGHIMLPESVPDSAVRPYKQVVTTVVRDAVLSLDAFHKAQESELPRSIVMTADGKAATHNITAITQITSDGVYKVFSDERLSAQTLSELFGSACKASFVKVWGGPFGGATPDYQGKGVTTPFLLYDGAIGFKGHTSSGALYYPVAMEQSSLSSMEMAAIGAKAVAKLVAERVGLLERRVEEDVRDEL